MGWGDEQGGPDLNVRLCIGSLASERVCALGMLLLQLLSLFFSLPCIHLHQHIMYVLCQLLMRSPSRAVLELLDDGLLHMTLRQVVNACNVHFS